MTMSAEDFRAWMVRMGKLQGKETLSERDAANALGWTRESIRSRLSGSRPVPKYIELACRMLEITARASQP